MQDPLVKGREMTKKEAMAATGKARTDGLPIWDLRSHPLRSLEELTRALSSDTHRDGAEPGASLPAWSAFPPIL